MPPGGAVRGPTRTEPPLGSCGASRRLAICAPHSAADSASHCAGALCPFRPRHTLRHHTPTHATTTPPVLRRRRADKAGVRRKDIPEAIAAKLGEANLLYAMQK